MDNKDHSQEVVHLVGLYTHYISQSVVSLSPFEQFLTIMLCSKPLYFLWSTIMINFWCHSDSSAVLNMKSQAIPVKIMKTYWRSENMAPFILNIGVRHIWVLSYTPRSLYCQGRRQPYPLNRMVCGWVPQPVWTLWNNENKSTFPRPEIESWFLVH